MGAAPSLEEFLTACRAAQASIETGASDSEVALGRCVEDLARASWVPEELEKAGKALMKLRIAAESKSRFSGIRSHMVQTLAKASAKAVKASSPKGGIDRVF